MVFTSGIVDVPCPWWVGACLLCGVGAGRRLRVGSHTVGVLRPQTHPALRVPMPWWGVGGGGWGFVFLVPGHARCSSVEGVGVVWGCCLRSG